MKKKQTRREKFLADMGRVVPWSRLIAVVEPLYPASGRVGRRLIGVPKMSRMYCLVDEALEDALYESQALRDFVGIGLSRESVSDATPLLKFRRLLLHNDLNKAPFEEINAHLVEQGLLMRAGTTVDATIIAALSSTKNEGNTRDPEMEMHRTKNCDAWHFGTKSHVGVDTDSGLVRTMVVTVASVNDVTRAGALLHDDEEVAFGDAGYRGAHRRKEAQGSKWHVAMQPGQRRKLDSTRKWARMLEKAKQLKASIRAKVEHAFHVIKNLFRHRNTCHEGLAKNEAQLFSLFIVANLVTAKRSLLVARA